LFVLLEIIPFKPMKMRLFAIVLLLSVSVTIQSCIDEPPGGEWQKPPRYGHGGTDKARKLPPPKKQTNRFGYSGDDPVTPSQGTGTPGIQDRDRDQGSNTALKNVDDKDKPAVDKPDETPSTGKIPFANGIPGNPLAVKVPGRNVEISIEQEDATGNLTGRPYPPGTPMSVPDPDNPGKEIYFKVP
jgi:hypothetical protein